MPRRPDMRLHGNPLDLIERSYATLAESRQVWLDGLRQEAEKLFDGAIGCAQAWEFEIDPEGKLRTLGLSSEQPFRAAFFAAHAVMPRSVSKRGYLTGPVPTLLDTLGGNEEHPVYRAMSAVGVGDMAGAIGVDPSGQGVAISWFRAKPGPLPPQIRATLERIAAHASSSLRLRNRGDAAAVEAVLEPGGRLLHAEGDARELVARQALRAAAVQIDKAKCLGGHRTAMEDPSELWTGLVEGRWSLVERFESDGRRFLVARCNDPTTHAQRALTENERKVVALLALGHSAKLVAYELGLTAGGVSNLMRKAFAKMGIDSVGALIELQGEIVKRKSLAAPIRSQAGT